ncbi:MAG: DUF2617 family protein [Pirellulaceae bacterium]
MPSIAIRCGKKITVLFVRPKLAELGIRVFARSVHPELFDLCATREFGRTEYQVRIQITTAGHLISFRHGNVCMTEVCSGIQQALPKEGCLYSKPIESQHIATATLDQLIAWESRFQIEFVEPRVFMTIQQQLDKQKEYEGLLHRFASSGRIPLGGVSYINLQAFQRYALIKSFHTFPDSCSVVKCESRFELIG